MITKEQYEEMLKDEKMSKCLNYIHITTLRQFVDKAIMEYGSIQQVIEANRVCDIMLKMLKKRGEVNENNEQSYVQVMVVAAMLHNLFYDGTFQSIYTARQKLTNSAIKLGIPENYYNSIFQMIECQLGYDMPVPKSRPTPGHPEEIFAWSCWFISELHGGKKMPVFDPADDES